MGENLQDLRPREAKPYTRAQWEIRFQRFALSFRTSALRLHPISARQVDAVNPVEFDGIRNEAGRNC